MDPNGYHDATESEHGQTPFPPPPEVEPALPTPAPLYVASDTPQRGARRVRRRSSADHLVFQRDPVAHLSRPLAPSPLSLRPTTEEEVIPSSTAFIESPTTSTSSSPNVETPAAAHIHARRSFGGQSRAGDLAEVQTLSRSSSRHGGSPGPDGLASKSHRSHPSLSLGSIFGRGSRPGSPVHDENRPESPQSNSNGRERGREKSCSNKRHFLFPHHPLGKIGLEEEHKQVGDGWHEFRKGTYTFPISFEIPSHMPPSLECDGGSVTWKLVAKVRRPGVFTSNLTTTRDVHVVSVPADTDVETTGNILIERPWDDQLQYLFKVSGKVFPIGASFNVKMMLMPLAKIRLYKLAVDIEERVDSYVGGMNMTRTVTSAIPLLNLQNDDETKPLLPLSSSDPLAFENSPFASLRPWGARASEVVSDLLGPGPWPVRVVLRLPADCGLLHPTSRSRDSSIHITHALRFTMRLARGDDAAMDTRTNKRKLFDVVVRSPVHILSCYARAEYTALPRYSETLDDSAMLTPPAFSCPCAAERKRRARLDASPALPAPFGGEDPNELLERTLVYERLVSGHESVLGDAPPAYDAEPVHPPAPHPSVIVSV